MTDARIITREELLEFVQAERHRAFEDGYELGQKMACLEKPEPDHKKLKHINVNPGPLAEHVSMDNFDSFVINGVRVPNPNRKGD